MRYVGLLVSLFAAVMMAACSHDDGPSVAEPVNVYGVDGVQSVFASVAAETDTAALMESNIYEPLISETRYYDFSTAKIVKPGSSKLVNIEVESYVNSKPDERITVRVTMVLQDGEWYLDSGTY